MTFERLPTTPTAEELVDQAFSRASRAGRAKEGVEAERSMLLTASNVLHDNLRNVVTSWPDIDDLGPFDREVCDAVVRRTLHLDGDAGAGVETLRDHLSEASWAAQKCHSLGREYIDRLPGDTERARKLRKQGFARMASVVEEIEDDLAALNEARGDLRELPEINADEPAVVVAGYPNVGKSSFVNAVTNATGETATYPFTTTAVGVGHADRDHIRYQIVDTPGLLDRPADERNEVESQAVSALGHLADCVLFIVDPSGTCGYPLDAQLALRDALAERFDAPVLTVRNKADLSANAGIEADAAMSVAEAENVEGVLDLAVATAGYEPELPFE
jgi:nucleolar GTP-binding protein